MLKKAQLQFSLPFAGCYRRLYKLVFSKKCENFDDTYRTNQRMHHALMEKNRICRRTYNGKVCRVYRKRYHAQPKNTDATPPHKRFYVLKFLQSSMCATLILNHREYTILFCPSFFRPPFEGSLADDGTS